MDTTKTKTNFKGAGEFDSTNSTYRHEIYLVNGKRLTGYSKSKYYAEKQDKIVLLEDIIIRLFNKGYLQPDRTEKITFYTRDFVSGQLDEVFTLLPASFTFGNNPKFVLNDRLNQFIVRFYKSVREKKTISPTIKHKAITVEEQILFSLERKRFISLEQLHEFVLKQFKNGYPEGLVMGFYNNYKEKYLSNPY